MNSPERRSWTEPHGTSAAAMRGTDGPDPDRYARLLLGETDRGGLGAALVEAGRGARGTLPAATPRQAAIRDVSAGVVAPTLIGFVLWLLLTAEARGLRRLYFLSRDGQVLLRVAEILARRLGSSVECRYLYASRQAWIHNLADPRGPDQVEWFEKDLWKRFRPGVTRVESILSRIGFDPATLDGLRDIPGLAPHLVREALRPEDIPVLTDVFRSERFLDAVALQRARNRELVLGYLAQEGLLDGGPQAIVDSGWAGQIHRALCDLLVGQGAPPAECFYFGFKERSIPEWSELRHWYLYSLMEGRTDARFRPDGLEERYIIAYLEVFCAAEHGTLVRYDRRDTTIVPVFPEGWKHSTGPWGIGTMRETIASVAETVELDAATLEAALGLRPAIKALFEAFWLDPSPEEAAAWGAFPLDLGEGDGSQTVSLAASYTWGELARALRAGRDTQRRHSYHWIPAGLALTSPSLRAAMRLYFGLRDGLGRSRSGTR
jgi:hypothetical protein